MTAPRGIRAVLTVLAVVGAAWAGKGVYTVTRWDAWPWFPAYTASRLGGGDREPGVPRHLIFVMADHYEPGRGERGAAFSADWLRRFRPVADRHRDTFGNRFRYSWFYPYDHRNGAVLAQLSDMAYQGYGEVELHWHHPPSTDALFPAQLDSALAWFRGYGALAASGPEARTQFAFIHGNWCLDGSLPLCGVNREITALRERGCYADLTFSTVGTAAQPRKINSLYWATDTDAPKSYDTGEDVRVGDEPGDRLLMFEGPLGFDYLTLRLEYGSVESFSPPARGGCGSGWTPTSMSAAGRSGCS